MWGFGYMNAFRSTDSICVTIVTVQRGSAWSVFSGWKFINLFWLNWADLKSALLFYDLLLVTTIITNPLFFFCCRLMSCFPTGALWMAWNTWIHASCVSHLRMLVPVLWNCYMENAVFIFHSSLFGFAVIGLLWKTAYLLTYFMTF